MPDNALKGGLGQCQGGQYYAQAPEHVPCQLDDAVSLGARSCMFGKQNCLSQTSLAQNCGIGSGKYRGREVDRPHTNSCSFLLHHFVPPVFVQGRKGSEHATSCSSDSLRPFHQGWVSSPHGACLSKTGPCMVSDPTVPRPPSLHLICGRSMNPFYDHLFFLQEGLVGPSVIVCHC